MTNSGTLIHWIIDDVPSGFGYCQRWAMPMAGDQVRMLPDKGEAQRVEVLFREFEQPERNPPHVVIHAKSKEVNVCDEEADD